MSQNKAESDGPSLELPRILCLHGGGTNARVFRAQCRSLISQLRSEFRLVFAEAPFPCEPGPDVATVYGTWGPFKRWLRWLPTHAEIDPELANKRIDQSLEEAIRIDNEQGGCGEWVGLLGFSQGAKVCASLLYRQQVRLEQLQLGRGQAANGSSGPTTYRFGVLLAGRAPIVSLDTDIQIIRGLPDASQLTDFGWPGQRGPGNGNGITLTIPTIHVHGLQDPGLSHHIQLLEQFCDPNCRRLVQWDGGHRVPLKRDDVSAIAHEIRKVAHATI